MKWYWWVVAALLVVIAILALVEYGHTQTAATPQQAADTQVLISQIQKVGCQAEENAAAQAILQLRKENDDLKAKLAKLDPPKSGATKH